MKLPAAASALSLAFLAAASSAPGAAAFVPSVPSQASARGSTFFVPPSMSSVSTSSSSSATTDEEGDSSDAAAPAAPASPSASSTSETPSLSTPEFVAARDGLIESLRAAVETKSMESMLTHFTSEYFAAAERSYLAGNTQYDAMDTVKRFGKALELGMKHGLGPDTFTFGVRHTALRGREPDEEDGNEYDFYAFGCDFFRPAMDMGRSPVLGMENIQKAFEQIKKGENVVFFANHQSEADPQVFSNLLESVGFGEEAADVTYVAGHKVTTDALAIPFSMGRNLLCIHSKKHIDSDPDLKPIKQRQNLSAMSAMLDMMRRGGAALWVAPSGGRDRRDLETGKVPIAPFDQKVIDMFRLMGNKSKVPTHYYPLAMVSYDLCPPPDFVEAGVGEDRNIRFVPIGINVMDELENEGGVETRHLFTELAQERTEQGYNELLAKIEGGDVEQ